MQQKNESDPFRVIWPVTGDAANRLMASSPSTQESPVVLPLDVLLRHNARILDPMTAIQPKVERRERDNRRRNRADPRGRIRYLPVAYVADEILVRSGGRNARQLGGLAGDLQNDLDRALPKERRVRVEPADPRGPELADLRARTRSPGALRLALRSDATTPPDAWEVLQALLDQRDSSAEQVGLNHLMFAAGVGGVGFSVGHSSGGVGFSAGHGFSVGHGAGTVEYAVPGLGGRAPVRWLGRPPTRQPLPRRPVVAILDTGVAEHPWFADSDQLGPIVTRLRYDAVTQTVVPADATSGGEPDPNLIDPLEGLVDPFFGHGTFIAGLIRQVCPDAHIVSVKIMGTDGIVQEADLINALGFLHSRQQEAREAGEDGQADLIDVVSLSLGYYHEATDAGTAYDSLLRSVIEDLGKAGVLVVASAGNDASSLPLLPAGFTSFSGGQLATGPDTVPLLSVGALNPDGSEALFSNSGSWVACHSPGAALVSTLPQADTGRRSGVDTGFGPPGERPVASWRATIDPDSFTGFGTWSGTSFAAPVAAAAVAQELVRAGETVLTEADATGRLHQALNALGFVLVVN